MPIGWCGEKAVGGKCCNGRNNIGVGEEGALGVASRPRGVAECTDVVTRRWRMGVGYC